LGDGLLRHPVTLYEIIFLLMLWVVLVSIEKKFILVNGARFKLFMISYMVFRFCIEFIKPHHVLIMGLSSIQLTCLICLLYYLRTIVRPNQLILEKIRPNA